MSNINLLTVRGVTSIVGMHERIADVKAALEQRLNLEDYSDNIRPIILNFSVVLRICLLAGLSDKSPRRIDDLNEYNLAKSNTPYATTFFYKVGYRNHV